MTVGGVLLFPGARDNVIDPRRPVAPAVALGVGDVDRCEASAVLKCVFLDGWHIVGSPGKGNRFEGDAALKRAIPDG